MSSLNGKVIAITGAASGLGLETARLLASRGAVLSIADINASALKAVFHSLPPPPSDSQKSHLSTVVDVRSSSQVNSWITATVAALGTLDCAVNVAGVLGDTRLLRETSDADWDFVMGVNATGVFNCLRAELNNIKDGGSIVNFASIASVAVLESQSAYGASKHAVLGLTKCAAREEGPRHIRVNCVAPGLTRTPIVKDIDDVELRKRTKRYQCIDRIADPIEIARVVAFLLSDEASFVTGAYYEVSGGWTA
ncbi:hypothetical protein RBB50_006363 [Rhinocladiella similis]